MSLIDQFGYGIKKDPIAIKLFERYARASFTIQPKFVFLMGRGMTYYDYHNNEGAAGRQAEPGSYIWLSRPVTNMLSSVDVNPIAVTPIGRLSVVDGKEIEVYLIK